MPRYHFHIHDGVDRPDVEGMECASRDAAWAEAVRSCGEMLKDMHGQLPRGAEWRMNVVDGAREPVFTLRFVGTDHAA